MKNMSKPIEVATEINVDFVMSNMARRMRILEVGCGDGDLAAALHHRGYVVTAIDSDEEAVARAKALGVPAVCASWPDFTSESVDAVLFTRSLHHMSQLEQAVWKSREILSNNGIILVDDFSFLDIDDPTINWLIDILRSPKCQDLISPVEESLAKDLLQTQTPLITWHEYHDHVHSFSKMTMTLEKMFTLEKVQSVPYLYRYLVPVLPSTAQATNFLKQVLEEEISLSKQGAIQLLGRTVVGLPRVAINHFPSLV